MEIISLTEAQQRCVDAVEKHGSIRAAARALGIDHASVMRTLQRAARKGYAPGHFEDGTAPGYVMGKVTVQRDSAGNVERTWERQSPELQNLETFMRVLETRFSADNVKPAKPITPPKHTESDLLAVYPLGDPHFGLYSWAEETGEDFDLAKADRLTRSAIDILTQAAPRASHGLLINLGDFYHADDSKNMTPGHGNQLDVDSRYEKVMQVGVEAMLHCTYRLLQKHDRVEVWNIKGNHDPHAHFALSLAMWQHFRNEPRVTINTKPADYLYYRFGKCLIASHHGHGAKSGDLPLLMAADRAKDWGETEHRVWHCGHIHHKSMKEHPGCDVESHRTLAGKDAWHAQKGYRSKRDSNVIVYHRDHGEVQRTRVDVGMLG
jgi:hypothetical protein